MEGGKVGDTGRQKWRVGLKWLAALTIAAVALCVLVSRRPAFAPVPFLKDCPIVFRQEVLGDPSQVTASCIIAFWSEGEKQTEFGSYYTSRFHGQAAVQTVQYLFKGSGAELQTKIRAFAPDAEVWAPTSGDEGVLFRDGPGPTKLVVRWKQDGNDSYRVTVTEYRPITWTDKIEAFLHNGYENVGDAKLPP